MTRNASIQRNPEGQGYTVLISLDFRCPACNSWLCELNAKSFVRIVCARCKGIWRVEDGKWEMIRPPSRIAGGLKEMERSQIVSMMAGQSQTEGRI